MPTGRSRSTRSRRRRVAARRPSGRAPGVRAAPALNLPLRRPQAEAGELAHDRAATRRPSRPRGIVEAAGAEGESVFPRSAGAR